MFSTNSSLIPREEEDKLSDEVLDSVYEEVEKFNNIVRNLDDKSEPADQKNEGALSPSFVSDPQPSNLPVSSTTKMLKMQQHRPQPISVETDPRRIEQRQKQIDLGKSTLAYFNYRNYVPLHYRDFNLRHAEHPVTPYIYRVCSKRGWDGLVRQWRRQLHAWDNAPIKQSENILISAPAELPNPLQAPPGLNKFING